jgi:glycosyltransferase involved in cell wall biosynthesis/putative flippase GtrA
MSQVEEAVAPAGVPVVDVVVPVYNEEHVLEPSVTRLHDYLSTTFPFRWQITIVDNASTDGTWLRALRLTRDLPHVRARHLDEKGRGRALRAAWGNSDAAVVAYMDVDLSTDLAALLPLVAPLVSGHSDVAIGSRLTPDASVARYPKREFVSRSYNLLLRALFATRVRDAQCGFKAVRADVVQRLLPAIRDDDWFFDTELLLLAERNGLRIHQVPVDWVDDADSRVHVARTAFDDLVGAARMAWTFTTGGGRVELGAAGRPALEDDFGRSFVSFAVVGTLSTLASIALFLLTRNALGAVAANAFAVSATFLANTWAHARFTARTRRPNWRVAFAIYAASLVLTSVALVVVEVRGGGLAAELVAIGVTYALATVCRMWSLRRSALQETRPC